MQDEKKIIKWKSGTVGTEDHCKPNFAFKNIILTKGYSNNSNTQSMNWKRKFSSYSIEYIHGKIYTVLFSVF